MLILKKSADLVVFLLLIAISPLPMPSTAESEPSSSEASRLIPIGLNRVPEHGKDEDYRIAKELGLNFIHEVTQWIEPKPGEYIWRQTAGNDEFLSHLKELKKLGYKVSVTFTNVHMDQKHLPAYLKDKRFNDPQFLERWERYLEEFLPRYGDYIDFLNIGNEVNNYFGQHYEEWKDYVEFFKRGSEVIRRLKPSISVGIVLVEGRREHFWKAVEPYCDHLAITYYTPCSMFGKSPTAEALDKKSAKYFARTLDEAIRVVAKKKLLLTEVGCATHPALDSSPELQVQFIEALFEWLRGKEDKILGVSWLAASDWPYDGTRAALKGYLDPALLEHEPFMRFLTSLGLRYEDGTKKPGYDAFKREIAGYRREKPDEADARTPGPEE
ncbi:MAG: hypothetical protein Q8Q12_12660 [bacterium]|nr:hypothetical protein [bacterium]